MTRWKNNNAMFTGRPRIKVFYDPETRERLTTREALERGLVTDFSDPLVASHIAMGAPDPREEIK